MADLDALLRDCPSTSQLSRSVIGVWPEHQAFLARNFKVRSPADGLALIEAAGFEVFSQELYATQGRAVEKALRDRISISLAIVGGKN